MFLLPAPHLDSGESDRSSLRQPPARPAALVARAAAESRSPVARALQRVNKIVVTPAVVLAAAGGPAPGLLAGGRWQQQQRQRRLPPLTIPRCRLPAPLATAPTTRTSSSSAVASEVRA